MRGDDDDFVPQLDAGALDIGVAGQPVRPGNQQDSLLHQESANVVHHDGLLLRVAIEPLHRFVGPVLVVDGEAFKEHVVDVVGLAGPGRAVDPHTAHVATALGWLLKRQKALVVLAETRELLEAQDLLHEELVSGCFEPDVAGLYLQQRTSENRLPGLLCELLLLLVRSRGRKMVVKLTRHRVAIKRSCEMRC